MVTNNNKNPSGTLQAEKFEKGKMIMKKSDFNANQYNGSAAVASVNEVYGLFSQVVRRDMERIGMRASYRHVMRPLIENESLTQLELVKLTGLKAPTISITLRNMEREGIVAREKNDADRRETHVSITEKGRQMHADVLKALERADKQMLKGISDNELKAACAVLEKMSANLRAELGGEKA